MEVLMDARVLSIQQEKSGIAQYILGLFRGHRANPFDIVLRPTSFSRAGISELGQEPYVIPLRKPLPWLSLMVPWNLKSTRASVFHGPAFAVPRHLRIPTVATIHDLTFVRMPETVTADTVRYLSRVVPLALKSATAIIVPSYEVQADLLHYYSQLVSEDRIRVIPEGMDRLARYAGPPPVPYPYIVHVGTVEPRKNIPSIVKAWDQVKADQNLPHRLVLIGNRGWKTEEFLQSLGERRDIEVTGYVDDEKLAAYLFHASLLVQGSSYEGFGLPVVEALYQGTPVVSTPTGIARELAHPQLIVTDNFSSEALAQGISAALSSKKSAHEEVRGGLMNWAEVYKEHAVLYREVAP